MILGAGIQGLCDDDSTHDHAEQRAREQGEAGAGVEQPERTAAITKFGRRENIDIAEIVLESTANAVHVDAWSNAHEEKRDLAGRYPGIGARPIGRSEHIGRRRERANTSGDRPYLDLLFADLGGRSEAADSEPVEIGPVDRDGAWNRERLEAACDQTP